MAVKWTAVADGPAVLNPEEDLAAAAGQGLPEVAAAVEVAVEGPDVSLAVPLVVPWDAAVAGADL